MTKASQTIGAKAHLLQPVTTAVRNSEERNLKTKTPIIGMVLQESLSSMVHHDGTSALYEALSSGRACSCQ